MRTKLMTIAGVSALLACWAVIWTVVTPIMHAQQPVRTTSALQPVSFTTLAPTSGTAIGLPASFLTPNVGQPIARCEVGPIETGSVRYRLDGPAPTTTVGHLKATGISFYLDSFIACKQFQVIATSTTASIPVTGSR